MIRLEQKASRELACILQPHTSTESLEKCPGGTSAEVLATVTFRLILSLLKKNKNKNNLVLLFHIRKDKELGKISNI